MTGAAAATAPAAAAAGISFAMMDPFRGPRVVSSQRRTAVSYSDAVWPDISQCKSFSGTMWQSGRAASLTSHSGE